MALTLSSKTSTSAAVSFPVIEGATALKIEKSEDGGNTWTTVVNSLDLTATSANINGLAADTHYKFRLVINDNCSGSALDVTTDPSPAVNSVLVIPNTVIVEKGNTQQLTANVSVTNGADQTITWSINDTSHKVTVDSNGLVSVVADATPRDYLITATSNVDTSKSGTATITVLAPGIPVNITRNPSDKTINPGDSTSFQVLADGIGLTYQWIVDTGRGFVNVTDDGTYSGATTDTLTINNAAARMNGYKYEVLVNGTSSPTMISNAAKLTVNSAPVISNETTPSAVIIEGTPAVGDTLIAQLLYDSGNHVTTSAAVSYKWYSLNNSNSNSDFNDEIGTGNTYTLTSSDANKYIGVNVKYNNVSFKDTIGKILNTTPDNTSNTNNLSSSIILATGSLGTAGYSKATGLIPNRKYIVKANGTTYYIVQFVTHSSSSSSSSSHTSDTNPVSTTNTTGLDASNNVATKTTTAAETKWTQDSNRNWFLILADGTKAKGWNLVKGAWYFCDTNTGVMLTGWFQDTDSNWYYLYNGSDNALVGAMLRGWQYIDNNWYYFNTSGAMESDTVVDGYTLGRDGALI